MKILCLFFTFLFATSCANIKFTYVPTKMATTKSSNTLPASNKISTLPKTASKNSQTASAPSTASGARTSPPAAVLIPTPTPTPATGSPSPSPVANSSTPSQTSAASNLVVISKGSCAGKTADTCLREVGAKASAMSLNELMPVYSEVCQTEASTENDLAIKVSACFIKARLLAALDQHAEAKKTRREACALNFDICAKFLSMTYSPHFYDVIDVADEMCSRSLIKSGFVAKLFLNTVCSVHKTLPAGGDLETEYVKFLSTKLKTFDEAIVKIRIDNANLPISYDFSKFDPVYLEKFQSSLRSLKFPLRVKFNLTHIIPPSALTETMPNNVSIFTTSFAGGNGDSWSDRFAGYAALTQNELYTVGKKFPFHRSVVSIPVTGTIVGYRETGVVPVPVIVLDQLSLVH